MSSFGDASADASADASGADASADAGVDANADACADWYILLTHNREQAEDLLLNFIGNKKQISGSNKSGTRFSRLHI
jgi:hypothetical protein